MAVKIKKTAKEKIAKKKIAKKPVKGTAEKKTTVKKTPAPKRGKKPFTLKGDFAYIPKGLHSLCVKIGRVKPLDDNPRTTENASERIALLIKENGFRKPIVIDQKNQIRAGHATFEACKILGMKNIPVAKSSFTSETDAMAYVISDNRASEFARWDNDVLKKLITSHAFDEKENSIATGLDEMTMKKLFDIKKTVRKSKDSSSVSDTGGSAGSYTRDDKDEKTFDVVISFDSKRDAQEFLDTVKEEGYDAVLQAL